MTKITYSDKQAMGIQPSIPEVNKVTDSDMNEIKTVVNGNDDKFIEATTYSTTETVIGTWINNKPIYRKVIYISSLPNATQGSYNTGVSNPEQCVNCYGFATNGLALNVIRPLSVSSSIGCWFDITSNQIKVEAGTNRSSLSAYVTIEYTKTTD